MSTAIQSKGIVLATGSEYPLPIPDIDGSRSELFSASASYVLACYSKITKVELKTLTVGLMSCGILADSDQIMLLWQFELEHQPPIILEGRFDARLIRDRLDVDPDQHQLISIHLVERTTRQLVAMRVITMPPILTKELVKCVADQVNGVPITGIISCAEWPSMTLEDLVASTTMHKMGD